ncbi:MAG: hypothetical protein PHQ98_00865 [Candidatus ainarchaeum sp.]|nr:hypothetical protein [Candidatus ainarchaeum sp.]
MFYESKLIHLLFPENTININAVRFDNKLKQYEVHSDRVPLHFELDEYMEHITPTDKNSSSSGHKFKSFYYKNMEDAYNLAKKSVLPVEKKMRDCGIRPGVRDENHSNVSLADPKKPVYFEPTFDVYYDHTKSKRENILRIQQNILRIQNTIKKIKNPSKRKLAQNYFNSWQYHVENFN